MLVYLGFGVLVLALGLVLLRAIAVANPAKLAQGTRTVLIIAAGTVAVIALILFIASERFGLGVAEVVALAPLLARGYAQWRRHQAQAPPQPGQASDVETDYLRMHLDHDTGTMSGTVRRGRFQGRHLGELTRDELIELWRECRVEDAQAAKLLETYLDHLAPDWREASRAGGGAASGSGDAMTREEALAILGLAEGASEAEIREAYHRLMMKIHPDKGGSAYLAAKLNRAREMLLG
jgi:DnaJ domain